MIDRTEMFCLVGLIGPNLESNHGRLYGKCFKQCQCAHLSSQSVILQHKDDYNAV